MYDLTAISFSQTQLEILSFGMNFGIPPKKSGQLRTQEKSESLYNYLKDISPTFLVKVGWLQAKLAGLSFLTHGTHKTTMFLTAEQYQETKQLKRFVDLEFTKSAKVAIWWAWLGNLIFTKWTKYGRTVQCSMDSIPGNIHIAEFLVIGKLCILPLHGYISKMHHGLVKPTGNEIPYIRGFPKVLKNEGVHGKFNGWKTRSIGDVHIGWWMSYNRFARCWCFIV